MSTTKNPEARIAFLSSNQMLHGDVKCGSNGVNIAGPQIIPADEIDDVEHCSKCFKTFPVTENNVHAAAVMAARLNRRSDVTTETYERSLRVSAEHYGVEIRA